MLEEETQLEMEAALCREEVARKYANFFQATLHHNTGYFWQARKKITITTYNFTRVLS